MFVGSVITLFLITASIWIILPILTLTLVHEKNLTLMERNCGQGLQECKQNIQMLQRELLLCLCYCMFALNAGMLPVCNQHAHRNILWCCCYDLSQLITYWCFVGQEPFETILGTNTNLKWYICVLQVGKASGSDCYNTNPRKVMLSCWIRAKAWFMHCRYNSVGPFSVVPSALSFLFLTSWM